VFEPLSECGGWFTGQQAAGMGPARICPMQTESPQYANRIRQGKLRAHAFEAAEQGGGTFVPAVSGITKLGKLLDNWDPARRILFCDEAMVGQSAKLPDDAGPWAIFIGPEGGFSESERARLYGLDYAHKVSLGPRILRADTAAVAAMTLWQNSLGDWS